MSITMIMMSKYKRVIICGKSASGKDYLRSKFIENKIPCDVSVTTRPKRDGEIDEVTYKYVSKELFEKLIKEDQFFEYTSFNGWYYGTLKVSWSKSKVFIMTPSAIKKLSDTDRKESLVIFLNINEETRLIRLKGRGGCMDSIQRRLKADNDDFEYFTGYDMMIVLVDFNANDIIKSIPFA